MWRLPLLVGSRCAGVQMAAGWMSALKVRASGQTPHSGPERLGTKPPLLSRLQFLRKRTVGGKLSAWKVTSVGKPFLEAWNTQAAARVMECCFDHRQTHLHQGAVGKSSRPLRAVVALLNKSPALRAAPRAGLVLAP